MSNPQQQNYQSYLIRFQRSEEQERWRATLQDVRTSQILHFGTEQELIHHLMTVLDGTANQPFGAKP